MQTTVNGLNKKVLNKTFIDVWSDWKKSVKKPKDFDDFSKGIKNKKIKKIWRRAKNVIFDLSDRHSLLVHQKMTGHLLAGKWKLENNKWTPEDKKSPLNDPYNRFIHLVFFLNDGKMIALSDARKFAKIELWKTEELKKELEKLGPEPLDKKFTLEKLKDLKKKSNFKLINYKNNRGKGYAVKTGMLAAVGKFRLFLDVDLSTPVEEMKEFGKFTDKYDVIVGTRKVKGSRVKVRQPIIREYLGKCFTLLSQIILNTWVSDFTCGFKCFSKEAAERIFQKTRIFRWGFDSESLFLAKRYGFFIKEIPVEWTNDRQTRVRFPGDIINSFNELLLIRYFDWIKRFY